VSIKILAVDDEDDVRRLIQIKLRKEGFEVLTAANGLEVGYVVLLLVYITLGYAVFWLLRRLARKPEEVSSGG